MKKLFKLSFLALAVSLSVVACNSDKAAEETTDSVATDSVMVDTTVVDSTVVDSTAADTTAAM
jgi:hypothetical protein